MDPLSFTASLLTVAGLGVSVAKNLEQLRRTIRDIPSDLCLLNNEVMDLRVILNGNEAALHAWQSQLELGPSPVPESDIMRILKRAEAQLQELNRLIASCLLDPQNNEKASKLRPSKLLQKKVGESNVALTRWVRVQSKAKIIQKELRMTKQDLSALLQACSVYVKSHFGDTSAGC